MAKITAKSLFASKTFWVAVIQAVLGVIAVMMGDPELQKIGGLGIVKSILDIALRFVTTQPVK